MAAQPSASTSTSTPSATAGNEAATKDSTSSPSGSRSGSTTQDQKEDGTSSPKDAAAAANGAAGAGAPVTIPVRDKESFKKLQLERYITRDWVAASGLKESSTRLKKDTTYKLAQIEDYNRVRTDYRHWFPPGKLYGEGYQGFGHGFTETNKPSVVLYPQGKRRPPGRLQRPLRWKRKAMLKQAEQEEELVPIRLEVEWDKIKLRDTFTWNLHDRMVAIEQFAGQLVEDLGIQPPNMQPVYDQIVHQMREQTAEYYPFVFSTEDALDPELPYSAYKNDEMRILIKLNITIGQHTLVDQFEWEINNEHNSPEEFARNMTCDLSLSGEFTTAIAHCIREQTQLFTRSLYSVGHPFDGRPIEDSDLVSALLPSPLPSVFRPQQQAKEYAPFLWEMSAAELERNETIFSREQRRQKRSAVNRRGGPQLPDLKERQRTIRTLIVSSTLPGAARHVDDSRLYKRAAGTAVGGKKRGPGARGEGEISDSEESEDSAPESPAPSALAAAQAGTARTRGMRGAASAAAQRMANLGRSETPEPSITHHHETRISRRFGGPGRDRDETEEPRQHLVVTLRVNKEKLRKLLNEPRLGRGSVSKSPVPSFVKVRPGPSSATPGLMEPPSTPGGPTSAPSASVSATPTPVPPVLTPQTSKTPVPPPGPPQVQLGRLPAPPPIPGQGPPTPVSCLSLSYNLAAPPLE
jgi:SWI/SNF-related matrix-associated actin-dependent regulator of chromatin subfamily B protein 1